LDSLQIENGEICSKLLHQYKMSTLSNQDFLRMQSLAIRFEDDCSGKDSALLFQRRVRC